jgi:crotonobetainyl-CoA:carnitine CoA-transferase CaiB-like acyl-CoA transferase
VSDNFRVGVLERLKIDYETLSKVNPGIICCSIAPFGRKGPMASRPGFDPLFQARSGLMRAQGGDDDEPVYYQIAVSDFMAALLQVYGVIAALHERERTGKGQLIQSSLAMGAMARSSPSSCSMKAASVCAGRPRPPGPLRLVPLLSCRRLGLLAVGDREQAAALAVGWGRAVSAGW